MSSQELRLPQTPSPVLSPTVDRRRPLLNKARLTSSSSFSATGDPPKCCCDGHFGEIAGGAAAECAAVWCCCPCGLIKLLSVALCKVPLGLIRAARKRKPKERRGVRVVGRCKCRGEETERFVGVAGRVTHRCDELMIKVVRDETDGDSEAMNRLENEMWEAFSETGFWRSVSRRGPTVDTKKSFSTSSSLVFSTVEIRS